MRAIMTAVRCAEVLKTTLPYNRHHFDAVYVITDNKHYAEVSEVAGPQKCIVLKTDIFYAHGALFNRWAALEWGLNKMGRHGWFCITDPYVLWPKDIHCSEWHGALHWRKGEQPGNWCSTLEHPDERKNRLYQECGQLSSPLWRVWGNWPRSEASFRQEVRQRAEAQGLDTSEPWCAGQIPPENRWSLAFPLDHQCANRVQIFHADDPALGAPPWLDDSFLLQEKWLESKRLRLPFEVLQLCRG